MSKHKAAGKLVQRVRPQPKFLGVKVSNGEKVGIGDILVRQRGTKFSNGKNVKVGRDHSLYSVSVGIVQFGSRLGKKIISVLNK